MDYETLFRIFLLFVLSNLSFAQEWGWALFDARNGGTQTYLTGNKYYDYYVNFIAGTTYNIFVFGQFDFNTTLTATDPSGYEGFNDDWGSQYMADGVLNKGSSTLDFTPTTSGPTRLRVQAAVPGTAGQAWVYVTQKSCSPSCTSKFLIEEN